MNGYQPEFDQDWSLDQDFIMEDYSADAPPPSSHMHSAMAPPMSRDLSGLSAISESSNFSFRTNSTTFSNCYAMDNNAPLSPLSIMSSSPQSQYKMARTDSQSSRRQPPTYSSGAPNMNAQSQTIPNQEFGAGSGREPWMAFYDFIVGKEGGQFIRQPQFSYLPEQEYPSRRPAPQDFDSETGKPLQGQRCYWPGCKAAADQRRFRGFDLERHFKSQHCKDLGWLCDYSKCPHNKIEETDEKKRSFDRWDHYKEHFRDYHLEDVWKARFNGEPGKKPGEPPNTPEGFLFSRERTIHLWFWRCTKCLCRNEPMQWTCQSCSQKCEPERVAWRERLMRGEGRPRAKWETGADEWVPAPLPLVRNAEKETASGHERRAEAKKPRVEAVPPAARPMAIRPKDKGLSKSRSSSSGKKGSSSSAKGKGKAPTGAANSSESPRPSASQYSYSSTLPMECGCCHDGWMVAGERCLFCSGDNMEWERQNYNKEYS